MERGWSQHHKRMLQIKERGERIVKEATRIELKATETAIMSAWAKLKPVTLSNGSAIHIFTQEERDQMARAIHNLDRVANPEDWCSECGVLIRNEGSELLHVEGCSK